MARSSCLHTMRMSCEPWLLVLILSVAISDDSYESWKDTGALFCKDSVTILTIRAQRAHAVLVYLQL